MATSVSASATVINIPSDYPTIQEGIDASNYRDTVLVANGHYYERINFNGKRVLLTSEFMTDGDIFHIQNTIIDADTMVLGSAWYGSVVCFISGEDSTSILQGFTIQNGIGTKLDIYYKRGGGGICCLESSPTISNNIIRDNVAYDLLVGFGGGIYIGGAHLNISRPIIENNLIVNNEASGGDAGFGGGIYGTYANAVITGNTIIENETWGRFGPGGGGGLHFSQTSLDFSGNIIARNIARWGAGMYTYYGTMQIDGNTFTGNIGNSVGGIYTAETDMNIVNTIIWGNGPGEEIGIQVGSPNVSYSNIEGGWLGEGNIDCNPRFCNPENNDYNLHFSSCCLGAGDGGTTIGVLGIGCGRSCDEFYVVGDFNGSWEFNVVDIVESFSKLATGSPLSAYICECPPESGNKWAVAMDVNNSCAFNIADVYIAYQRLALGEPELEPCEHCPPAGR